MPTPFRFLPFFLAVFTSASCARGDGSTPSTASYNLHSPRITRETIGLKSNQVLVVPFSSVSSFASHGHHFDEYVLKLAMAGLINRNGPLIWLDMVDFMGGPESNLSAEIEWRQYYEETRNLEFVKISSDLDNIISRVRLAFAGIVLYEDGNGEPSDNVVLALNIANLNRCLPVSRRIYEAHKMALGSLNIIADISSREWTRSQVYEWLLRNVQPLCSKKSVYSLCAGFDDNRMRDNWSFLHGLDYAFYRNSFIFNLTPLQAPMKYDGVNLDGDDTTARLFDAILNSYKMKPIVVFGWGEPEPTYVERVSAAGHYVNCTAAAVNLSFHAAVKPLRRPPYQQIGAPKIDHPEKKVYIALVANEGDAIKSQTLMYNRAWSYHPGRGSITVNWAVNPASVELFPSVFEYYSRTRTGKDYFVGAPNGAGYLNPAADPWLDNYLRNVNRTMPMMGIRELGLWYPTKQALERYAKMLPDLRGMDITPADQFDDGQFFFTSTNSIPVIRYAPKLWYWMTKPDFQKDYRIDIDKFRAYLETVYLRGPLPRFVNIYGVEANLVGEFARLAKALDPLRFEFVDYATFFHLAKQAHAYADKPVVKPVAPSIVWKPDLLHQISVWQTRMNDAEMSAEPAGLRVTVSPGKTWAVVAIPSVALPHNVGRIRIRVRGLQGKDAEWIVKLYGDLDGFGIDDNWFVNSSKSSMTLERALDPRIVSQPGAPWMLQLGVSGPPGSTAVFESVEFLPGRVQ